jgi:hypothetical protein
VTRVRITYDGGMELMDVQADDSLAALAEALGWIKHKRRARGCYRRVVRLEVEPRALDREEEAR